MKKIKEMKKSFAILIAVLLVILAVVIACVALMPKCASGETAAEYSLSVTPFASEQQFDLGRRETLNFKVKAPENGLFTVSSYDVSEYLDGRDPAEVRIRVSDAQGKTVAKSKYEIYPTLDLRLAAGEYTVEIKTKSEPRDFSDVAVNFAFAPTEKEVSAYVDGGKVFTVSDKNGGARFSVHVDNTSLVSVSCGDAVRPESDCNFTIINSSGNAVVTDCLIHMTEWFSRNVLLEKGDYELIVSAMTPDTAAMCKLKTVEGFESVSFGGAEKASAAKIEFGKDTVLGFKNRETRWFTFTADKAAGVVRFEFNGNNTYYDCSDYGRVTLFDSEGKKLDTRDDFSGYTFDLSKLSGTYFVSVEPENAGCAVKGAFANE